MLTLWYARRAREQNRRINRMMRDLPIRRAQTKASPPEPMKLPEGWLQARIKAEWAVILDEVITGVLLALVAVLLVLALTNVAVAEDDKRWAYVGDGYVLGEYLEVAK